MLKKQISKKQASDAGMAAVLILLLIGLSTKNINFYKAATVALILNMISSRFYHYFAIVWFGLAELLGTFVSKILLSIVYFLVVLPVAIMRRISGKDTLKLKQFKKSTESVMIQRNHSFTAADIEKPF